MQNEIASLPDSFSNLTQLHVCDLSGNRLHFEPRATRRCIKQTSDRPGTACYTYGRLPGSAPETMKLKLLFFLLWLALFIVSQWVELRLPGTGAGIGIAVFATMLVPVLYRIKTKTAGAGTPTGP